MKKTITVVIPALNEERAIGNVINDIPVDQLSSFGYSTEIIVVDNASTDKTSEVAKKNGATVVYQPLRGYGNAYKAGFAKATGDIIVTGDADSTYPFSELAKLINDFESNNYDFMNTDRLSNLSKETMELSHIFGNWLLTIAAKILFRLPFKDSQSGMWIFKRSILSSLNMQANGMQFSEEIKIEAHVRGFKCGEVPINYMARLGESKLHIFRDGYNNLSHMVNKRIGYIQSKKLDNNIISPVSEVSVESI